jgi:hypothetical protein
MSDYLEYDGTVWTKEFGTNSAAPSIPEQAVIDWMTTANERLGHNVVRVTPEGEKPCWQLKLVEVREEEIVGLTRPEFRALVREKLQEVGDDLLQDWDKLNGIG